MRKEKKTYCKENLDDGKSREKIKDENISDFKSKLLCFNLIFSDQTRIFYSLIRNANL